MTVETLSILAIGAVTAGFINGLAGFGTSLFALGWWLQVMSPLQAVSVVLIMSVSTGLQGAFVVRKSITWRELAPFLVPALFGIPIGLYLLTYVSATFLKILIGGFLLAYGSFFLVRRELPNLTRATPMIDHMVGFLSGILGAIAGLSGALPTMWLALRNWTKDRTRAILQPFNIVVQALSATILAISGTYTGETLTLLAVAFPLGMLGSMAGIKVYKRLADTTFRKLLIFLMFVSGFGLLVREVGAVL